MTDDELIEKYPTLYHMAERCSWRSIEKHGLLSTSALLDLYSIPSSERGKYEKQLRLPRPEGYSIPAKNGLPRAVIRDQKPMNHKVLEKCLQDGLKPCDWYQILNSKCFFWLDPENLKNFINAYPDREHDVLEIDTHSLLKVHRDKIRLSHINSGATLHGGSLRGKSTFATIDHYPYAFKRSVAELTVEYAVLDIRNHKQWVGGSKEWQEERYPEYRR